MVLKLYYDFLSQPSRAVYILLKKCEIPFESHIVEIVKMQHKTEEYEAINPFGLVPAIEHDGFKVTESVGIARYLCREFKLADHWYPNSSKEQARVDEYLAWQHLNTRLFCSRYFLSTVAFSIMRQRPPHPQKVKQLDVDLTNCLDAIENKWLKDNKAFLVGGKISIADIFAACEIEQTRMAGYDARRGRPKMTAWLERVARETAPHYEEAHRHIDGVIERLAGRPPYTCSIDEIFP